MYFLSTDYHFFLHNIYDENPLMIHKQKIFPELYFSAEVFLEKNHLDHEIVV